MSDRICIHCGDRIYVIQDRAERDLWLAFVPEEIPVETFEPDDVDELAVCIAGGATARAQVRRIVAGLCEAIDLLPADEVAPS